MPNSEMLLIFLAVLAIAAVVWVISRSRGQASDKVDPLAEAEVYVAYGRKQQAIEILEGALKDHPSRRKEFESRLRELKGEATGASPIAKM